MNVQGSRFGVSAFWGLVAVVSVLVGCSGNDGTGGTGATHAPTVEPEAVVIVDTKPEVELLGAWLLEDLGGRGVMDMVQTTIEFSAEGGVVGAGGCNRYTGSYTFDDGRLEFSPLAGTKMMCPEAVMDQEDRFHQALAAVERVEMDGPFLLIFYKDSEQPLRFTRMEPDVTG